MYNIGIDLGGTTIKIGIVNSDYEIIARSNIKTEMPRPAKEIIDTIAQGVLDLCNSFGCSMDRVNSIGIGTPGTVDNKMGIALNATNLDFKNVPLGKMLSDRLQKKVFVENDANAAAYGEYLNGSGKGYSNVVVITLGTGAGSGIIINGKIYGGYKYCGAEFGHSVIEKNGVPCKCGRNGCFESYCSATGLIRMTREAMLKNKSSKMWEVSKSLDEVNGKTSFDAMRMGDNSAIEVVNTFLDYLGCGLTNIVNIFQPEIILIGGGLCKERDAILEPVREYIKRESFYTDDDICTKLDMAKLGNDAGIIGAAYLTN